MRAKTGPWTWGVDFSDAFREQVDLMNTVTKLYLGEEAKSSLEEKINEKELKKSKCLAGKIWKVQKYKIRIMHILLNS